MSPKSQPTHDIESVSFEQRFRISALVWTALFFSDSEPAGVANVFRVSSFLQVNGVNANGKTGSLVQEV